MQVYAFTAPAHWASYLINGDASGLAKGEKQSIDQYMQREHPGVDVHDVGNASFSWSYGMFGGDAEGGDLADYSGLISEEVS